MGKKKKVIRVAALSDSLRVLLKGQLRYLNNHFDILAIGSGKKSAQKLAEEEGVRTIPLRIERRISPFKDIKSLWGLYRLFRKEKPYLVHSITPKAGLLSMTAAYFARVPNRAHTFTGLVFPTSTGLLKKLLIFFDKLICYFATDIYPEGQGVKKDLLQYKITRKELKIIANGNVNGINLSHFDPSLYKKEDINDLRQSYGITPKDFVFLFVGRIGLDKGIIELVSAFLEVQKDFASAKLMLVGTFEKEHDPLPEDICNEIEQNEDIVFAGWQTDVRPFFMLSNVFILPSYREGFPNVVLQAGAMGKFSIVTDINGSNEIIENGLNGTVIPVKDKLALESAMLDCIKKPIKYKTHNLEFRKIIAKKYEQDIVWTALLKEYQNML